MKRGMGYPSIALLAMFVSACGSEAGIWLRVEAPLRVPEDADAMLVELTQGDEAPLFSRRYELGTTPFPATLMLHTIEPSVIEDGSISISAAVFKSQTLARPWARGETSVSLRTGRTVEVVIALCDCAPTQTSHPP